MIQPTLRAFAIFTIGVPVALFLVIYEPALWPWSFDYGILVLVAIGTDLLFAFPRRLLQATVTAPASLQVGERGAIVATIAPAAHPRPVRFELVREQRPEPDPGERVVADLAPGAPAQAHFALLAQRRGHIHVDAVWARWRGPLGLVQLSADRGRPRDRCRAQCARGAQLGAAVLLARIAVRQQDPGAEGRGHRVRRPARLRCRPR
ncbi:MAG TPA: hypothetical protein VFF43_17340, partial [Caldimonas sp.]|nr:hypothetical protein [Caldimonas sp.]